LKTLSTTDNIEIVTLTPDEATYPAGLHQAHSSPPALALRGNPAILTTPLLALFGSRQCPARLILHTHDLAQNLRQAGTALIGGFHTPVEQEALTVLLRGPSPLVICPARSLEKMRLPKAWRTPLEAGRLLVLSPFTGSQHRVTARLASERNRLVAALATRVLFAHAAPGGNTESLCREVIGWGKPVFTFDHPANAHLMEMGATSAGMDNLAGLLTG
jgi:predicted Rossmann fold nucleotide-binding protein DprA/Smf involved in DNA uptake